jgi:hypothetical protein
MSWWTDLLSLWKWRKELEEAARRAQNRSRE